MIRKILVLTPEHHGERQKIDALANVIADAHGAEIAHGILNETKTVLRRRVARFLMRQPPLTYLLKRQGFFKKIFFRLAFETLDLPANYNPDVVITSQANRLLSGVALSILHDAKWVLIGIPKHVSQWQPQLTACITVTSSNDGVQYITKSLNLPLIISLDVVPTRIRLCQNRVQPPDKVEGEKWGAVFIGGNTRGEGKRYYYDGVAWDTFIQLLRNIAVNYPVKLMLSTSPRTGKRCEEKIETFIRENKVEEKIIRAVCFGKAPEDVVPEFLSKADFAIVTEDSRSMISDCIAAGVPVFIFRLSANDAKTRHRAYFDGLRDRGLVQYIEAGGSFDERLTDQLESFAPLRTCWSETLLKAIKPVLDQ